MYVVNRFHEDGEFRFSYRPSDLCDVVFDSWIDSLEDGLRDLHLHPHYGLQIGCRAIKA